MGLDYEGERGYGAKRQIWGSEGTQVAVIGYLLGLGGSGRLSK